MIPLVNYGIKWLVHLSSHHCKFKMFILIIFVLLQHVHGFSSGREVSNCLERSNGKNRFFCDIYYIC